MSGHTKMYDETKTKIKNKLLHIANFWIPEAWGSEQSGVFTCRCMKVLKSDDFYEPG